MDEQGVMLEAGILGDLGESAHDVRLSKGSEFYTLSISENTAHKEILLSPPPK